MFIFTISIVVKTHGFSSCCPSGRAELLWLAHPYAICSTLYAMSVFLSDRNSELMLAGSGPVGWSVKTNLS